MKNLFRLTCALALSVGCGGAVQAQGAVVEQGVAPTVTAHRPVLWVQGGMGIGAPLGLRFRYDNQDGGAVENGTFWNQPKEFSAEWQRWAAVGIGVYGGQYAQTSSFPISEPFVTRQGLILLPLPWASTERRFTTGGLRATVHLTSALQTALPFRVNPQVFDVYVAAMAGLTHATWSEFRTADGAKSPYQPRNFEPGEDMRYHLGLVAGVRVMPVQHFGLYVEGGLGPLSQVQAGAVVRF